MVTSSPVPEFRFSGCSVRPATYDLVSLARIAISIGIRFASESGRLVIFTGGSVGRIAG